VALYGDKDPQTGFVQAMRTAEATKNTSHVLAGLAVLLLVKPTPC
jgi:hypothetical protein